MRRLHGRNRGIESGCKFRVNDADRLRDHSSGDADTHVRERAAADHKLKLRPYNSQQTLAGRCAVERAVAQGN